MDAKSDEFKRLPLEVRKFWNAHIKAHAQAEMIVMMTLQGGMPPMGGPDQLGSGAPPIVAPGGEGAKAPAASVQTDQTNNILREK